MNNGQRINNYLKGKSPDARMTAPQIRRLRKKARKAKKRAEGHYHSDRKYP